MCGPTAQEESLQQSSQNFSSVLQQHYETQYGRQLDVLDKLSNSLNPILAAGPNQRGMSAEELNARNTQAINAAGAASRSAQQAARTFGAGEGGGATSGVTSGITKQIESAIGTQVATNLGNVQGDIVAQDYAKGSENYWRAQGAEQQLAAGYNPNASASGAISSNSESFGQAKTIQQQQSQKEQMIAGGITSLAMGAATGGLSFANDSNFLSSLGGGKIFGSGGFFGGG